MYYNNKGKDIVLNDYSNWEQLHIIHREIAYDPYDIDLCILYTYYNK